MFTNILTLSLTIYCYISKIKESSPKPYKSKTVNKFVSQTTLYFDHTKSPKTLLSKICKFLIQDTTIRRIVLKADAIQIGEIRDALKWNRKVKELVLQDMVITSDIMKSIAGLLQFSMSLERIHFSFC